MGESSTKMQCLQRKTLKTDEQNKSKRQNGGNNSPDMVKKKREQESCVNRENHVNIRKLRIGVPN